MRALFTFFLLAFALVANVQAQTSDSFALPKRRPITTAAALFGVNISSLNNYNGADSRLGLMLGFAGDCQFGEYAGIAAELDYSQQGSSSPNGEYQLNYLKMPVMLTLNDNGFQVQGGLYGAMLLKGKAEYGNWTEDVTGKLKQTELGLCLGLAYNFLGYTRMGVRFSRGLDNINKNLADSKVQLVNSTLQVYGGYTF